MEFEKLQMIIAEVLGKDSEQIYAKARLVEDLGEDTFDVILEEEAVYQVKTVQDLCNLVMIPA